MENENAVVTGSSFGMYVFKIEENGPGIIQFADISGIIFQFNPNSYLKGR